MGFNSAFKGLITFAKKKLIYVGDKGKAIPLEVWTSPECSSRFRLPDFKTIDTRTL
jgi:hypothetical protein